MTDDFSVLGTAPYFIKRLQERNIIKPTDIQKKVIPRLAAGESLFFSSATGTGKTFAYLLPLLGQLLDDNSGRSAACPRLLIAAPTLELCRQIKGEIDFLLELEPKPKDENSSHSLPSIAANKEAGPHAVLRCCLLIGSVNLDRQIESLKKNKCEIFIGNPARLLVLAKMKKIKFSSLNCLVLDEADRLVSEELYNDTYELCKIIRRDLRDLSGITIAACSATMNKKNRDKLMSLAVFQGERISRNAGTGDVLMSPIGKVSAVSMADTIIYIESEDNEILRERIEHWAIFSEKRRKDKALRSLLAAIKAGKSRTRALIFTSRGDDAQMVLSRLLHHHVKAVGLFSKSEKKPLSGTARKEALDAFRRGAVDALVSTDLASRGLDIPGITHIIALDVPQDFEVYIHRCGRTARAGKRGVMVTIGDETQMRLLASLEKKLKITVYPKELHYGQIRAPLFDDE